MRTLALFLCLFVCLSSGYAFAGQNPVKLEEQPNSANSKFQTASAFALDKDPLVIRRPARANQPFSVTGQRGAILGQQDGTFELWLLPVKILRDAKLTARLIGYDAEINLNEYASDIEVRPDHTTITYAHAAITVKQHMFIPQDAEQGIASAIVFFEVHAARPAELTLSFSPSMEREWPAPNFGRPGGEWIPRGSGGAYLLQTDDPSFFGYVAMPQATHGPIRPYQERPLTQPLTFQFSYDPAPDDRHFYPLVAAMSDGRGQGHDERAALLDKLVAKASLLEQSYRSTSDYYAHFFDTRLTVDTPDRKFNDALKWAEIAIEQSKIARGNSVGLAAGWFTSGDSARPGFGWFFGRDTLWTLYAVNSYGDFSLARQAMDFLLSHQRQDGKMMHEYSQTAETVDWASLPYLYASADSTPLFIMLMEDYVRSSGDLQYLQTHWDDVRRAYNFTRAHTTDGVYDNSQGTGWVEEWLPRLPHQEIYLAALDQQSSAAMSDLARWMKDDALAASAYSTAETIRAKLASYRGSDGMYAFSRNADGSFERVPSVFPSVAWWSGSLALPDAEPMFHSWASSEFSTDWGARSVSTEASIYDPISYHHGSVWPLYTGWVSMAEFRSGNSLAGMQHLMQNVELTTLQDPGFITEVLSGFAYEPLGRSSSHQLWSSSMVLSPAIRGLFGVRPDALQHTLQVAPQLPADWDRASLKNVQVGQDSFDLVMMRKGSRLEVDAVSKNASVLCLSFLAADISHPCTAKPDRHHLLYMNLPAVEIVLPGLNPIEGEQTSGLKVLSQKLDKKRLTVLFDRPAGSVFHVGIRKNMTGIAVSVQGARQTLDGFDLSADDPKTNAAPGTYVKQSIVLTISPQGR